MKLKVVLVLQVFEALCSIPRACIGYKMVGSQQVRRVSSINAPKI